MKLIAGSMEGYTNHHKVYSDIMNTETERDSDNRTSWLPIPILVDTARKIARYEGTHMDKKQYVAYEVICCTFLLVLVTKSNNPNSLLSTYLKQVISSIDNERDTEKIDGRVESQGWTRSTTHVSDRPRRCRQKHRNEGGSKILF